MTFGLAQAQDISVGNHWSFWEFKILLGARCIINWNLHPQKQKSNSFQILSALSIKDQNEIYDLIKHIAKFCLRNKN